MLFMSRSPYEHTQFEATDFKEARLYAG